jgi:hypothetical protein
LTSSSTAFISTRAALKDWASFSYLTTAYDVLHASMYDGSQWALQRRFLAFSANPGTMLCLAGGGRQ